MHVLVVEADPHVSRCLLRTLKGGDHTVAEARDCGAAEAMVRSGACDVLLLGMSMPGRPAVDLCRALRRAAGATPIVMLTARDTVEERVLCLDAGADDCLGGPPAPAELLARLRALARRRVAEPPSTRLEYEDVTMDLLLHEVRRGGRLVELSPREFALLALFLSHPRVVLSRAQILAGAWGPEAYLTSNVVDTYVHYLRSKLDGDHERSLLRTVRGFGYALHAS